MHQTLASVASPASLTQPTEVADQSPGVASVSRRQLLSGAAALSAFWAGGVRTTAKAGPPMTPADVDPSSLIPKLVGRITYGHNQAELDRAFALGYHGYLEYHLAHEAIDDSLLEFRLSTLPSLYMTAPELYLNDADRLSDSTVRNELTHAKIIRAVYSNRQLFERVVEFWSDHFNIDAFDGDCAYLKTLDERDTIRANAFGTFPAMLNASARSPAMLLYLNNNISTASAPNENYGRELLELHTCSPYGPNGESNYTQSDVLNAARALTGWKFWSSSLSNPTTAGTFRYDSSQYFNGTKTIMGLNIPNRYATRATNGIQDGQDLLNMLAAHPGTAHFVSKKMCKWFLGENVADATVRAVASVFTATGGNIKSMIRKVLEPNNLAAAEPKLKRPFHLFTSLMRVVPTDIVSTSSLRSLLSAAGNLPYAWGPPDGYPDTISYWSGLLTPRWNFGFSLYSDSSSFAGSISGLQAYEAPFFSGLTTADQMIDRINQRMFGGGMPPGDRTRIRDYMLPNPPSRTRQREAIALAAASPAFQWY